MTAPSHPKHSVLVVDDQKDFRKSLCRLLTQEGADVLEAESGNDALARVSEELPCFALIDMVMPGMDGLTLCGRIRQDPRTAQLPIIVVTGEQQAADLQRCIELGVADFIRKPCDPDEMRFRIRTQIRFHEALLEEQKAHQTLAAIASSAMDAIFMTDEDDNVCYWNAAAASIFGYRQEEILGRNVYACLEPEWSPGDEAKRQAFLLRHKRGEPAAGEIPLTARRNSGERFPVEASFATVRIAKAQRTVVIARDITERRRSEEALAFQNVLLRTQQEAALDGILVVRAPDTIVSFNRRFVEMWGIPEDILATRSDDLALKSILEKLVDPQGFIDKVARLYAHCEETSQDEMALKDGRTFDRYSAPMIHSDGSHLGRVWYFRDITGRKRGEEALRISEQRYRASFEGASVGQALVSCDGQFIDVNRAFARMLGYDPTELRCKRFADITFPEDLAVSIDARKELLSGQEQIRRFEKRYLRKDGSLIWADVNIGMVQNSGGTTTQFITHVIDISERKQMEEELRAQEAARQRIEVELRHSQKLEAVGQLAAGIAHEINTPTQFVTDSLHFIKEAFDGLWQLLPKYRAAMEALAAQPDHAALAGDVAGIESEVDLEYLLANLPGCFERCFDGVARITNIVRAMKEFAHPGPKEKRPADLNQAIKNTLVIAHNEYKYVADLETNLGEVPPVVCQLDDLNQVFLNLIVNAAHAISEVVGNSGRKGKICVSTRAEGDSVCVDIADTGGGVPEAIRERIFEPFFTTKPVGKGTGQGLAIARAIVVDMHGGALTFRTAVGAGTTFTIRLPIGGNAADRTVA